nr:hypothetical protein MmBV_CQP1 [Microplitis mediator bracovirus]
MYLIFEINRQHSPGINYLLTFCIILRKLGFILRSFGY